MNRKSGRLGATLPRILRAVGAGVFVAGLSGGCEFQSDLSDMAANIRPKRTDLIATGQVKGQAVSGQDVVVSLPVVFRENNDLLVSGTVTRRSAFDGPVPGFLDVQVLGPDGKQLDEALLHWTPEQIPTNGTRSARYQERVLGYPPAGSTVRVVYTESVTELPSFAGTGASGGGSGRVANHAGGGGHH